MCIFFFCVDPLLFPVQLSDYGFIVELLSQAFDSAQSERESYPAVGICVEFPTLNFIANYMSF